MNKNSLVKHLKTLRVILKYCPAKTDEEIAILVNEYYAELQKYSDYVFDNAVLDLKRNESDFPTLSTLLYYCGKFWISEIDRLNKNWKELKDDIFTENKPTEDEFKKLANEWRKLGVPDQADFVMKFYKENKDYHWLPPDSEKLKEYKKRLEKVTEKLEVK